MVGEYLKKNEVTDLSKLRLDVRLVYFTDSTTWAFGRDGRLKAGQTDDLTRKVLVYDHSSFQKEEEPVTITGIEAHGRSVNFSEPFSTGDPEWLKDLTVTFQNRTERTIKSVVFYLIIREGHPMYPPPAKPILYGTKMFSKKEEKVIPPSLAPGEIGRANMESELYDSLRKHSTTWIDLVQQTTAEIRLNQIIFTDGVKWKNGCYHSPDPANPGRWLDDCMK